MTTLDAGHRPAATVPSALFAATVFSSAVLVFLVQPMVAKLVLPLLGGSPSVWNTSMVFFQAALLAGYGYAHLLQRIRSLALQSGLHVALLVLAALTLPPAGHRALRRAQHQPSHPLASRRPRRFDRRALRRPVGDRAPGAGLARPGDPGQRRARTLQPLRRQQSRQPPGVGRLSGPGRAVADPGRPGPCPGPSAMAASSC